TEAEWEYACRANSATLYWFGDDPDEIRNHAWLGLGRDGRTRGGNSKNQTHPVRELGHDNPFGLFDMHGNVAEWCWDWSDFGHDYQHSPWPSIDPIGPSMPDEYRSRRTRGGSFKDSPWRLRSSVRTYWSEKWSGEIDVGFRIARNGPAGLDGAAG